jgi:hypothetical protein
MARQWAPCALGVALSSIALAFIYVGVECSYIGMAEAWKTQSDYVSLVPSQTCTMDRVPMGSISEADFRKFYLEQSPVIFQGSTQTRMAKRTEKV